MNVEISDSAEREGGRAEGQKISSNNGGQISDANDQEGGYKRNSTSGKMGPSFDFYIVLCMKQRDLENSPPSTPINGIKRKPAMVAQKRNNDRENTI